MIIRTYSELIQIPSFEDRFEYLRLNGIIGESTFGFDRYLNQMFYKTKEWRDLRRHVILRDNGHDLGMEDDDYEIHGHIYVHHMNPITVDDILQRSEFLLNPEYLISTSYNTHQAITFSDKSLLMPKPVERFANDTCPWKQNI